MQKSGIRTDNRRKVEGEFGEMVITSAFQADFVGSSPITRKESNKVRFSEE